MNLQERLKQSVASSNTVVAEVLPKSNIAQKVNRIGLTADSIREGLQVVSNEPMLQPSDIELAYVASVFENKGFHQIDLVTFEAVSDIGRAEFVDLNNQLKTFTSKMTAVKTPGLFPLMALLQKDIDKADFEGIWNKTVNAKPTLMARFLNMFDRSAKDQSLTDQYQNIFKTLTERGKGLEATISDIERKLVLQKAEQLRNIAMLESSFEIYYQSFVALRKQYILCQYLEYSYAKQLENYKATVNPESDLMLAKNVKDYENMMTDISNRRLMLHAAMLKLPITVEQNKQLIRVCKNLTKEIDITQQSSFPSIRSSMAGLGISLNAQQGMLGNEAARKLEENSSKLLMKTVSDLSVKSILMSSESRLQDANNIKSLVEDFKNMHDRISAAEQQSAANYQETENILNEVSHEIKHIVGK